MQISRPQAIEALCFALIALSVFGVAKIVLSRADLAVQTDALATMSSGWLDTFGVPHTRVLEGNVETIQFTTAEGAPMSVLLTPACVGIDLIAVVVGLFVAASHLKVWQKIRGTLFALVVITFFNPIRVASFIWVAHGISESSGVLFHGVVFPLSIILIGLLGFSSYPWFESKFCVMFNKLHGGT